MNCKKNRSMTERLVWQRTRSFRCLPYVASGIKTLMKENFQRVFLSEASQG